MQSFYVFCILPLLIGTISAVVNLGDDHVIFQKPQTVSATPEEHDESDHDHHHDDEDIHEVANNATDLNATLAVDFNNATVVMDNSTHGLDDDEDYPTIGHEVDENGCQLRIRNELERKCFSKFEDAVASSLHIENAVESEKKVCCALEEYEKCCYHGYKVTNCNSDKDSLKETLKAARIFLGAITKNSCSSHRGKCAFSSAGNTGIYPLLLTCSAILASFVALV